VDPGFYLQLLLNGIVIGCIYALIAMGLSLIFGVLEIVNFAHGEFYMLGAMLAYFLTMNLRLGYAATVLVVTASAVGLGYLLYEALLVSVQGGGFERSILLTLGLSMVLQNGAVFLFTTTPRMIETQQSYTNVVVGDLRVSLMRLLALGLAVLAFAALYLILYRTRVGKAMRGVAQSREAALAPVYAVHPLMGASFVFKAFAIIILGGLGNIAGAAIAALSLGVLESVMGGFLPVVMVDALVFSSMIAMLLVRPQGLFGRGVRV